MICEQINLYENRDDVTLTTYVLADSAEMLNGGRRPAILICPGGGYLNCSDREGEPVAMAFAAMGYHAFVLRYSTFVQNGNVGELFTPLDELAPKPHCTFPNTMWDIGKAILYIRSRASEWLVDEEKIGICGFSAGAHNCATYAVYWNKPEMRDHFNVEAATLKPALCILGYPISDYANLASHEWEDAIAENMHTLSMFTLLGVVDPGQSDLAKVSPALLVDENVPPTFLWATSADSLVPVQQTTMLATALANKGIPFEVHIFENGAHGLSTATQSAANTKKDIDADASKWVDLCCAWLAKRFALDIPAAEQMSLDQKKEAYRQKGGAQ